jgi:hypothetical protein
MLVGTAGQAFLLREPAAVASVLAIYEHLLAVAAAQGGWLGPEAAAGQEGGMVYWPRWPVMMFFASVFEFNGDARGVAAGVAWCRLAAARVEAADPALGMDYAGVRTQDWLWAIFTVLDLPPAAGVAPADAAWLEGFARELQARLEKIVNYEESWYVDPAQGGTFVTTAATGARMNLVSHGVNNGMALKSGAMRFRLEGGALGRASSFTRLELMDRAFNAHHATPARCARNCDPNKPQNPNPTARPMTLNQQATTGCRRASFPATSTSRARCPRTARRHAPSWRPCFRTMSSSRRLEMRCLPSARSALRIMHSPAP